jgi:hypothetical protein
MNNKSISNNTELVEKLLNEQISISERLEEYNKFRCLAFMESYKYLSPLSFGKLFENNPEYQKSFEEAKINAINEILRKRQLLNYEGFLRYVFFDLRRIEDHKGAQVVATYEAKDLNDPFIYNIIPRDETEREIFERVAIEHIKATDGKGLGKNGAIRLSGTLIIGYSSLETLKNKFRKSLEQPFADIEQVKEAYFERYVKPLKNTETKSIPQSIYKALKSGTLVDGDQSHYYCYYAAKASVIEIIKFEEYLNNFPFQQTKAIEAYEVKNELHNHIFKDNAFEVFEKYHYTKSLAESSRTDLNLLFQLFKKDNLFVETIELKHYIQWLNKTYGYGLTELKKVDINSKPNIRRTNDYKEYKNTTLK